MSNKDIYYNFYNEAKALISQNTYDDRNRTLVKKIKVKKLQILEVK